MRLERVIYWPNFVIRRRRKRRRVYRVHWQVYQTTLRAADGTKRFCCVLPLVTLWFPCGCKMLHGDCQWIHV